MSKESDELREVAKQLIKSSESIRAEADRLIKKADELDKTIQSQRNSKRLA